MKIVFHQGLTTERWFKLTLAEQLANVGTDVSRTIDWKNKGNLEQSECAFFRALELLSLTIIDPKNKGARRKELCRAREALLDHFMGDNEFNSTDKDWHDYFIYFNYVAAWQRSNRQKSQT